MLLSTLKEFENICLLLFSVSSFTCLWCSSLLNVKENTDVSQSSFVLSSSMTSWREVSRWWGYSRWSRIISDETLNSLDYWGSASKFCPGSWV